MNDDTEIRDLVGKAYTELKKACEAVSKSKQAVMTYIAAAREISTLARDERSISAEEVVAIYDRTRGASTISEAIAEFNDFPNFLANNPPAISVLWYNGAVTLVENIRDELSLMKRCISDLVDVEADSHVWKPEAIEKHRSDFGAVCFLLGEWSKGTSRILKYWAEIKDGTFQNLTYKKLPRKFDYLNIPDGPDIALVTQLSRAVKEYCSFTRRLDWQPEIEPMKKILDLDQRLKESFGRPYMAIDDRSTHDPYKAPTWVPSPEFQALMEASRRELGNAAQCVRECSSLVDTATMFMSRVSETCASDRPSCVSDLYRFIDQKPMSSVCLDENFAEQTNKGTSLVITLLRISGAALVVKELDKSWSIFDRKLGRSICAIEDVRSIHAGSCSEKTNEAGRHIKEILEHNWRATIYKWEDIRRGAVLVSLSIEKIYYAGADVLNLKYILNSPQQSQWDFQFSRITDHNQILLKQLNAAADHFLEFRKHFSERHRIKLFRELLELDLRFQRSIGWEILDS